MGSITEKVLSGGGEMGALMRSVDWSKTALGSVDQWPQSLRTMVSVMLGNRHPMANGVLATGEAPWNEHFLFPVNRREFLEETYFTFPETDPTRHGRHVHVQVHGGFRDTPRGVR